MSIGFRNSNAECTLIPFKLTFADSRKVPNSINIPLDELQNYLTCCSSKPNIKHRLLHAYMNANWITIQRSFCAMCVFKLVMIINTAIPVKYESLVAIMKRLAL